MARKKETPMNATETKFVRLELDMESHQHLRVVAAQHGKSMSAYVKSLVEQDLASRKKGGSR